MLIASLLLFSVLLLVIARAGLRGLSEVDQFLKVVEPPAPPTKPAG